RVGTTAYSAINRGETFALEVVGRRRDNEPVWLRITGKAIDPLNTDAGSIWNYEDITARKLAEESARKTEILQQAILESAQLAIISTDNHGCIVSINPATEELLGYRIDDLEGKRPNDTFLLADTITNSTLDSVDVYSDDVLFGHARVGEVMECECLFRKKDGSTFPVQLSISALSHGGEENLEGFLLVAADISVRKRAEEALRRSHSELEARVLERTQELESEISERKQAENRLRHLAHHDALTDLPNRAALRQHIENAIQLSGFENKQTGVYFIDLDRFKNINDSLGHHAGDALLIEVATRLRATLRSNDTVARLGGDEFVVVTPLIDSPETAEAMAEKLLDALRSPCMIEGHEVFVTPSIPATATMPIPCCATPTRRCTRPRRTGAIITSASIPR
ncbi:MAG TPA: diguanylate cyclase, partial [Rhodocyclaceae bacterium]|nr:diguanylate cyclase [Rhodocyclaceae bacterium]